MTIVNVGYDSANYYVVEQNGVRLLIDVGWPGTLPKLLASLKRKGFSLADLSYLVVTHYHPDHAGLVQELKDKGVKHLLLEEQVAAVPQQMNYMKPTSGYVDILVHTSIHLTTQHSRAWMASIGFQGEIVPTPGHSFDSISIVLDEGIAFTGDLLPPSLATEEQAGVIQESWNRLYHLNVRTIYPGHGPVRPIPGLPV